MIIEDGTVVRLNLEVRDEAGQILEHTGSLVLEILMGAGYLVPGLEAALIGMATGDTFDVTVPAAYGEKTTEGPQRVPRREIGRDVTAGQPFQVRTSDGTPVRLWVHKVDGKWAWIDRDHPHAGKTCRFQGTIRDMRAAHPQEIAHGHVHAAGHDHD